MATGELENNQIQLELERIYKLYRRKMGKGLGMERARKKCRTLEKLKQLEAAVENYNAYLDRNKVDPKFVKHFSSFMSHWKDWLDPSHGTNEHSILDLKGIGFD